MELGPTLYLKRDSKSHSLNSHLIIGLSLFLALQICVCCDTRCTKSVKIDNISLAGCDIALLGAYQINISQKQPVSLGVKELVDETNKPVKVMEKTKRSSGRELEVNCMQSIATV